MNRAHPWMIPVAAMLVCGVAVAQETSKETQTVEAKDIKLTVPKTWKSEKPSNNFRVAQFKIDAAEGDKEAAELAVMQFGGGGGGVDDNIKRWINQFDPKDRKVKISKGKCPHGEYIVVDLAGTYLKPDGPPFAQKTKPTPGSRVINIMLMVEDKGSYFFKLSGPDKTVAGAAADLRTAFGANISEEKEQKPE
jgi:gluconolactonase